VIGRAVLPRLAAVVCVVLLSACTARVGGSPVAGDTLPPPEEPAELTAELVFGDFATIAPCSLTDPDVFDEFGDADFATPESLDYCAISVDPSGGGAAVISVGALGALEDEPELAAHRVDDLDGGLWIGQQDDDPQFCSQLLVFPDDVTMQVAGSAYEGEPDTCAMVEAGMAHAVEAILAEEVEHRDPDEDSLQSIDPCDTVRDREVSAIAGLAGAERRLAFPGEHTCYWTVPDAATRTSVRVVFGAGPVPRGLADGANENPVAGRPTATNPYPSLGDGSYCAVETGHIPFDEVDGEDAVELASVFVRMPAGQVTAACAAAVAVATIVWQELPAA
jgi:hypothetical protein